MQQQRQSRNAWVELLTALAVSADPTLARYHLARSLPASLSVWHHVHRPWLAQWLYLPWVATHCISPQQGEFLGCQYHIVAQLASNSTGDGNAPGHVPVVWLSPGMGQQY